MGTNLKNKYANEIEIENNLEQFNADSINMFNEKFTFYRDNKIIRSDFFSDSTWVLENNYDREGYVSSIDFDFKGNLRKYNLILKCLLLSKLDYNSKSPQPETLVIRYRYLATIIKKTKGFNPNFIESFEEYMEGNIKKTTVIFRSISGLNDLEAFYPQENIEDYFEVLTQYYDSEEKGRARSIPHFKSLIIFNLILKREFPLMDRELKKKFYPLYLWWNITMIIPLRPSEFLKLKSNCCWKDDQNRYWIRVPRSKVDDKNAQIKLVYELETNEKIFKMIKEYKEFLSEEFNKSEYLMPHEVYKSCFSYLSIGNSNKSRIDKEKLNPNDGNSLLRQFYEQYIIIEERYGNIEQLRMGDTRHYAFCNMLLQGLNGLTIAQIGGHTRLKSQMHYYQQLNTCSDAYVSELADRIYLLRQKRYNNSIDFYEKEYKSSTFLSVTPHSMLDRLLEIENGYCTEKFKDQTDYNFDKCTESCHDCDFHILDFKKYPHLRKELQDKSSQLDKVIKEQLDILQSVFKDMLIDYAKEHVDFISDMKLKEISAKLKDTMDRKAKIDSYFLDYIVKEESSNGV